MKCLHESMHRTFLIKIMENCLKGDHHWFINSEWGLANTALLEKGSSFKHKILIQGVRTIKLQNRKSFAFLPHT